MRILSKLKKPKATRIIGGALGLLLVLTLVLMPVPVLAAPQIPHQFYGTVTIGTGLAPEGTIVSAKIDGVQYGDPTKGESYGTVDAEGRYGDAPLFKVPADDPYTDKDGGVAGETVEFYITNEALGLDEVKANETAEFEIWGTTLLDLIVPLEELEYGDAPDPGYPSLLASDGVRHDQSPGAFLGLLSDGDGLDWEFDANVPDQDSKDDGLVIANITAGKTAETVTFEVTDLSAPTYGDELWVNILIDLNADDDWTDPGDHVVVNQVIHTTVTVGEVFVSDPFSTEGATLGPTWLRITLTRHEILDPPWDGTMTDGKSWGAEPFMCGETEDWEINIVEPVGGGLSATEGPDTPSAHDWYYDPEGDLYNEMLQIALTADATEDMILNSITVEASGSGNDATGIALVYLVLDDSITNGLVDDPAELPAKDTGAYATDNGSLTLTILGGCTIPKGTTEHFIIAYQMTALPAAGDTFIATVTDISAVGASSGLPIPVTGPPIVSATKTTIITEYTLTMEVVGEGTVTPESGDYAEGDMAITATPASGWEFSDWSTTDMTEIADASLASTTLTLDKDKTVTATFTEIPVEYTLDVTIVGSGSVTKDPDQVTYAADTVVELTATADSGWSFSGWSGDLTGTTNPDSITMDGNKAVTATFATLATHALTMEVVGEGTVTPESGVYAEGDMAITATPASGWEFSAWSTTDMTEIADASLASTTLTLDKDKTVTATFTEEVTYTLTMVVLGTGTVTPETGTYPEGDMTITAIIPASGWEFSAWSTTDMDEIADPALAETTLTLDKDKTVTATFTPVVTYDLTVDSAAGGSVTDPGEDTFTYNTGTVVDLVAVPEDGYAFGWWSGDVVADANAASTTITMDSAKSIVANFVAFSAPENVSVTEIDPGVEGVEVTVKATEELDVTEMPAGIEPQEAYVVEPTGEGSFTLSFTDVDNASDIRVYKVVDDGTWTLLDITVVGTTIEVTMDCADPILVFALPPTTIGTATLLPGWNLLSTPIKLDADSDSVEQILGESVANIELSYRWDAVSEKWAIPTGYELSPLEAIYLKVKADASATAEFIPSQELSWLPSRQLQPGLNLIGPAPAFDLEAGVFPDTPLDEALVSIEVAGEFFGYCMVVSPAHNQPDWTYALGMEVKDLLPYKGYWVVMDNADTMYGFSTTPISP